MESSRARCKESCRARCIRLFVFWRTRPYGAAASLLLGLLAWLVAHRSINGVARGLYDKWTGASQIKHIIIDLDFPFLVVNAINVCAALLSFAVHATDTSSGVVIKTSIRPSLPKWVWFAFFGVIGSLVFISVALTLFLSDVLLIVWLVIRVLSLLCGLPAGLLPMADDIIDNIDSKYTGGLDLVQFCPDHKKVDHDALRLFFSSAALTLAQASMLACITAAAELVNLDLFHIFSSAIGDSNGDIADSNGDDDDSSDFDDAHILKLEG